MKYSLLLMTLLLVACAPPQPAGSGALDIVLSTPASLGAYAPFAPLAATDSTEACATLRFVRALAKPSGTSQAPYATDVMLLDASSSIDMKELPTGDYDITIELISAAERVVFSGTDTVTIRADDTASVVIKLEETGGCPRPNPLPPTVESYPDFSGCTQLTFRGTKPKGTILVNAADSTPIYNVTQDTTWSKPIFISGAELANGFSLESAWSDERNLTSIDKLQITLSYDADVLCFDPYAIGGSDYRRDGASVTLAWKPPENGSSVVGTVIVAYNGARSGNMSPIITAMTMADVSAGATNATVLAVIDSTTISTASVTLPDLTHNWDLHLFSVKGSASNSLFARDAGAVWIPSTTPVTAPAARRIWP